MTATTHTSARLTATLVAALTVLAIAAAPAGASLASQPPKLGGTHMHWYHGHPSTRALQGRTAEFGSTAVLGLESMHELASLRAAYGFERVRAIPALHAAVVSVDQVQLRALLANAPSDPRIRYVAPVGQPRRPMSVPSDPLVGAIDPGTNLPYEWQFADSRVDRALDLSKGDPTIVVGTIDTGAADVPDLTGKVDGRWSFAQDGTVTSESPPEGNDDYGHGTAVASLIAANVDDGFGMAGYGGATHVIAFRAGTQGFFLDAQVAIALTKLVSLGARIVNLSIGGSLPSEPILVDSIHKAAADGVLLVASAGNEGGSHVSWPAADLQPSGGGRSFGLAVGATDVEGRRAYFSNSGEHLSLVAPGTYGGMCSGVLVAVPPANNFDGNSCYPQWTGAGAARYAYIAGTSFAAPEVAGVAALIWAARPELTNYQVADIIKQSARRDATSWTPTMGCGLLDAGAALELATGAGWTPGLESDFACSDAGNKPPTWPTEANQTISFDALANKTVGDPDFAVRAHASSGLPISFTASGNCTAIRATVHITTVGSCTITATQPGDANYNLASAVSQSFSIAQSAPRSVHAIASVGRFGSSVSLGFRVSAGTGDVAVKIKLQKNRTTVARLSRGFFAVESRRLYALAWRAPAAKTKGVFRFCVTLRDRAGNKSEPSCGRIRLK
jgi:subtilisin family serine protease